VKISLNTSALAAQFGRLSLHQFLNKGIATILDVRQRRNGRVIDDLTLKEQAIARWKTRQKTRESVDRRDLIIVRTHHQVFFGKESVTCASLSA
jgi:hypothetical protein